MTSTELIDKWGSTPSFTITAGLNSDDDVIYTIGSVTSLKISEFSSDFEKYFNAYINRSINAKLDNGPVSPLEFNYSFKEPIEYSVKSTLNNILRSFDISEGQLNQKLKELFDNEDFWKKFMESEREIELKKGDNKEVLAVSVKAGQGEVIGGGEIDRSSSYNRITLLDDIKISVRIQQLTYNIEKYIGSQEITAFGTLITKGTSTFELIDTPEIGNWNTVIEEDGSSTFVELKREDIIKDLKNSIEPLIGEDYHSYSITDVGNSIRVETTPFDKEPFDVEIKNIRIV